MAKQELTLDVLEELSGIEDKMKNAVSSIDGKINELKEERRRLMNVVRTLDPNYLKRETKKK